MLNKITDKERDVQYALGLVSWYYVSVEPRVRVWGNFRALSEKDAIQQFKQYIINHNFSKEKITQILENIANGYYQIKVLSWRADLYR